MKLLYARGNRVIINGVRILLIFCYTCWNLACIYDGGHQAKKRSSWLRSIPTVLRRYDVICMVIRDWLEKS